MSVIYAAECVCGAALTMETLSLDADYDLSVVVHPCDSCLAAARAEGNEDGYVEGYAAAEEACTEEKS